MTYSLDFRQKVLSVRKRNNLTFQQVANRFSVGIASVARRSKNPAIKAYVRVKTHKIDLNLLALDDVEIYPDADQDERFGVCQKTIGHALKKLNVTYKKSPDASQSERRQTAGLSTTDCWAPWQTNH